MSRPPRNPLIPMRHGVSPSLVALPAGPWLTALDFLGFGMPAGSASLGELVTQGKQHLEAPWLGFTAFFAFLLLFPF